MRDTDNGTEGESRRQVLRKGAIACGGAIGGLGVLSGTVAADPIEIDECMTITESGEYILTDDISAEGTCIQIMRGNVSIDGNGYSISGDGTGRGIYNGVDNSKIHNLSIENFSTGVRTTPRHGSLRIKDLNITNNTFSGIGMSGYTDVEIYDSTISNNSHGISPHDQNSISITDSTLNDNADGAIPLGVSTTVDMEQCVVENNGQGAVVARGEILDCKIRDNDGFGLKVATIIGAGGTLSNNIIENNSGAGIIVTDNFTGIQENTIRENQHGILLEEGPMRNAEVIVTKNNIEDNQNVGIQNNTHITVEATCNYWGHATGPEHEDNPRKNPKGDKVSDNVDFTPWSVREIRDGEGSCNGGRGRGPN